jgi:hypothetical protein
MKSVHGNRGFCNIKNEAILKEYIREKYGKRKMAIGDTDCHHGDGTQDIYWHDSDILFISLHQGGIYPGSGYPRELGGPNARGKTINIPLPANTSEEGFIFTIDKMVLPILKDFKPELIVNSAGQDNHYTDPITNMNFTAHGYALLNEKLNPDIAVLEGGYSIQGALPYVNLGIVLAMAGLDYSSVKEPDYSKNYHQQSREVTDYVKKLEDQVLNCYFNPAPDLERAPYGEFSSRRKNIYYDTDGIQENQQEHIMMCKECRGVFMIDSTSSVNSPCIGIEIPVDGCNRCQEAGYRLFDQAVKSKDYMTVQLTDRVNRVYKRVSE